MDRRTDMTKPELDFSNFAKAPEMKCLKSVTMETETALLLQLKPWDKDQRGVFANTVINQKKKGNYWTI
jgi:hypothetical protein